MASIALVYAALSVKSAAVETPRPKGYEIGDAFGDVAGIDFADSRMTLVMFHSNWLPILY